MRGMRRAAERLISQCDADKAVTLILTLSHMMTGVLDEGRDDWRPALTSTLAEFLDAAAT
jgi:hypothetical protein